MKKRSSNDTDKIPEFFLDKDKIEKTEDERLFITVNDMNDFSIKALEKDKDIIQDAISQVLNQKIQLVLSYNISEQKNNKTKDRLKIENDEDHPLFMEALGKFKGKLIK